MDNLNQYFSATTEQNYVIISISLICCIFSSFILKYLFNAKSVSISSKHHISSIIPTLSLVTFLIILIVKSSLALSLGLIGALSIVRFRTPIKEPEELIYLFFSIAIGIGFGAGQIIITISVFIVIIIIIWFFSTDRKAHYELNYNLFIEYDGGFKKEQEQVINKIEEIFKNIKIKKIETSDKKIEIMCEIKLDSPNQIDQLKEYFKNAEAIISYSEANIYF